MKETNFIAEIGWNHMGDMNLAKSMIDAVSNSGAKYAKFQTWSVKRLSNGPWDLDGRREIYDSAELSHEMHLELYDYCNSAGVTFFSSVFSLDDAILLSSIETDIVKIPSFEACNYDLLRSCFDKFNHVVISTGTCSENEILALHKFCPNKNITIMHCVSSYPCKSSSANLPRIRFLKSLFANVGYSDHVEGINASIAALEYDISLVEKHFTINHDLPGRDNKFAILPGEMKSLVQYSCDRISANADLGTDYQDIEQESRDLYRNRFNNK